VEKVSGGYLEALEVPEQGLKVDYYVCLICGPRSGAGRGRWVGPKERISAVGEMREFFPVHAGEATGFRVSSGYHAEC
jgi:hypothetical protein